MGKPHNFHAARAKPLEEDVVYYIVRYYDQTGKMVKVACKTVGHGVLLFEKLVMAGHKSVKLYTSPDPER